MLNPGEFTKDDLAVGDIVLIAVKNYLIGSTFDFSFTKNYDNSKHFMFKLSILELNDNSFVVSGKTKPSPYEQYTSAHYDDIRSYFYDEILNQKGNFCYSLIYSKFEEQATAKVEKIIHNGMNCKRCNLFCEYISEPNMPDNSFLCYSCRTNPTTMFILGLNKR